MKAKSSCIFLFIIFILVQGDRFFNGLYEDVSTNA